jgi:hypothetical protein
MSIKVAQDWLEDQEKSQHDLNVIYNYQYCHYFQKDSHLKAQLNESYCQGSNLLRICNELDAKAHLFISLKEAIQEEKILAYSPFLIF